MKPRRGDQFHSRHQAFLETIGCTESTATPSAFSKRLTDLCRNHAEFTFKEFKKLVRRIRTADKIPDRASRRRAGDQKPESDGSLQRGGYVVGSRIDTVIKLAQEFDLFPAARGRLQVSEAAPANLVKSVWDLIDELASQRT